ncbi:rCG63017 [Rattus norvegicus]|uniref:RCG63017 n=1 Tax=Rattus norvegicus TaxID=10116 RepID=A6ITY0_RAT|nr:rCG63017 [Rattus norvegicus]
MLVTVFGWVLSSRAHSDMTAQGQVLRTFA